MEQVLQMVPQTRVLGSAPRRAEPAAAEEVSLPSAPAPLPSSRAYTPPPPSLLESSWHPWLDSLCPWSWAGSWLSLSPESWPVGLAGQDVRWEAAWTQMLVIFTVPFNPCRPLVSTSPVARHLIGPCEPSSPQRGLWQDNVLCFCTPCSFSSLWQKHIYI